MKSAYVLIRHDFKELEFEITEQKQQDAIDCFVKVGAEINQLKQVSLDKVWDPTPSPLCSFCSYRLECDHERFTTSWEA